MAGYIATSSSPLNVAIGIQTLQTQSALSYVIGQQVQVSYTPQPSIYLIGAITNYNPVNGVMSINVTSLAGSFQLQAPFNTQVWGGVGGTLSDWTLSLVGGVPSSVLSTTPTIIVRKLGPNWDPIRGQSLSNFLVDIEAVAQIIVTSLLLLQGEWFENVNLGLPLFQQLLGHAETEQGVALIIQQQILQVPYVTGIQSFAVSYAPAGRVYSYQGVVNTQFGLINMTGNSPFSLSNLAN